uniref:HTH CENPB-type domain-containing protein n=1 Tax=Caenorhabditis japonica TaxID=281687 RepID=A0A8R1I340_CAEJA
MSDSPTPIDEETETQDSVENFVGEVDSENRKRRKNYTLDFKKRVADFAFKTDNQRAADKYGVPRQCIQKWKAIRDELDSETVNYGSSKKKRLEGGGRHVANTDFDNELAEWVTRQRANKLRVTRSAICIRARQLSIDLKVSNGWLESFLNRHRFVSRRPTTVCQKAPDEYIDKIIDFFLYVEKRMRENQYNYVYACDETSVNLDYSNSLTVEEKGSKQVTVKSTGHDKLHLTVMLTARSDGFKCRPYVLLLKKRTIPAIVSRFGKDLQLSWSGRTFFNDELTKNYLETVIGTTLFGKRLLVWDSYRCHISADTKKVLKTLRVDSAVIPGGTTKFIQWIVDAWKELPVELIKKSFTGCGLNNAPDGSDDGKISCFKNVTDMSGGIERLKQKRQENSVENLIDDININEDEEDAQSDISIDIQN